MSTSGGCAQVTARTSQPTTADVVGRDGDHHASHLGGDDDLLPDIRLSRTITPTKAGEPITILSRQFDDLARCPIASTTTDASGNWSVDVTATIQTDYTAQTNTSQSQPVTVPVHLHVGFGVNGNSFSANATGRDSFAGAVALFQVRNPSGSWRRLALVVINQYSVTKVPRQAPARPHLHPPDLPPPSTSRAWLPQRNEPGTTRRRRWLTVGQQERVATKPPTPYRGRSWSQ